MLLGVLSAYRPRPRPRLFVLAIAGLAVVAWSCGSDDAEHTTATPPQPDAVTQPLDDAAPPDAGKIVKFACTGLPRLPSSATIALSPVFTGLAFARPTGLFQAPGDPATWYVVEQTASIVSFPNTPNVAASTEVLAAPLGVDLGTTGEGGLLGFAFHPSYATNGTAFAAYTVRIAGNAGLTQRIARLERVGNGKLAKDVDLFERAVPAASAREEHNLGGMAFGADGNLYVAMGDGYIEGDDPANPAQDPSSVFGKILRITVGPTGPYSIPDGNPFKGGGGAPEVFALGFRNPWRFSFDRDAPHSLWVGDVGDDTWEEINKVEAGKNYGWSTMEGAHCHVAATCSTTGLVPPVVEYQHTNGVKAVIGGYVYRGKKFPSLHGTYFYADFSGVIWSLPNGSPPAKVELETDLAIVSFAQDLDGELYVLAYESLADPAKIFQITAAPPAPPTPFPKTLKATGCVDEKAPTNPVAGLVPYDLNSPLWSDGADKRRWFALPQGTQIHVRDDGDLEPPIGTTLIKEFRLGGKPVETRLFVRHADGDWGGYSYEWNDDGSDATLLETEKRKTIGSQEWFFPSRAQCLRCHTVAAGRSLGLEIGQLNRSFTYPDGRTVNQLAALSEQKLIDRTLGDPATQAKLPEPFGADPIESRTRSYLHANCSFCHRSGGTGEAPHDFLFSTAFAAMMICDVVPTTADLGIENARLFAPNDPARSIIPARMKALDGSRMPPFATSRVDPQGVALIEGWIRSVAACP